MKDFTIHAKANHASYLKDLLRYRELFYFFAWRDILVRYKQAIFGISWAIVRPVLHMAIFAFLFGRIANLPSDGVDYGLFVLAGMMPWMLFSNAAMDACTSLVNNSQLVSKVYFPRLIIPMAQIIVHFVDFLITTLVIFCLALFLGQLNLPTLIFFPFFTLLTILLCMGIGLWLSALTVKYRDFRIIVPFIMQFGMFISPVGYGSFIIDAHWQWLYMLNPLVGIIDGFRWSLFGVFHAHFSTSLILSISITAFLLATGFYYFRQTERTFADTI